MLCIKMGNTRGLRPACFAQSRRAPSKRPTTCSKGCQLCWHADKCAEQSSHTLRPRSSTEAGRPKTKGVSDWTCSSTQLRQIGNGVAPELVQSHCDSNRSHVGQTHGRPKETTENTLGHMLSTTRDLEETVDQACARQQPVIPPTVRSRPRAQDGKGRRNRERTFRRGSTAPEGPQGDSFLCFASGGV